MTTYYLSTTREASQEDPFLLRLGDGNILGFWADQRGDPGIEGHYGVYGRFWLGDLSGANADSFPVPDLTDDIQKGPYATPFRDGSFAVTFESRGESERDGSEDAFYDVYVKFYEAGGAARGPARQLTSNQPDDQFTGGIATLSTDQSVTLVARQDGPGNYDLVAYRHSSEGNAIGGGRGIVQDIDVGVNAFRGTEFPFPDIAAGRRGSYAVTWQEEVDSGGYAVKAQVFGADGAPLGEARILAPVLPSEDSVLGIEQITPRIVGHAAGFALAWTREPPTTDDGPIGDDVYFRLIDAEGRGETRAVRVNSDRKTGDQFVQDVVDLGAGYTLVTYVDTIEDAFDDIFEGYHLHGRVMGPDGRAFGRSFRITEEMTEDLTGGNTIVNGEGALVSTYSAEVSYADSQDVFITSRPLSLGWRWGDGGAERLDGTLVNDRLRGQGGDDRIYGNTGDDTLSGGRGDDRLVGQRGNDRLMGGGGEDIFVLGLGRDVIEDFADGRDRIEVTGASRAEVRRAVIDRREQGGDTVVTLGEEDSIRIKDTDPDEIGLGDLLF